MHNHSIAKTISPFRLSRRVILWLVLAAAIYVGANLFNIPVLVDSFNDYLKLIWWAVLLGLFLGGMIEHFVPDGFILKYLGRHKPITLFYAVIGGFIMSACSHGILALAIQLYKKGASTPATITFLMASPWANLPVTLLLFGLFGVKAFLFILGAMIIALITGFIFMGLERLGWIEKSPKERELEPYTWEKARHVNAGEAIKGVSAGSISLANMVLWWIVIGFLAAVFIRAFVPAHWFTDLLSGGVGGLMITLGVATIIEICSEGSAPLAFEIFDKVGTIGHAFVFLMAGVATDYTEIGLLWSNIGKKTAIWLPIVAVPQIIIFGIALNVFT